MQRVSARLALASPASPASPLPSTRSPQVRILEVLLSVHRRDERAAMLPDAFTPPCSSTAGERRVGVAARAPQQRARAARLFQQLLPALLVSGSSSPPVQLPSPPANVSLHAAVDDDDAYFSAEEDQVYTTPLRLLQAIDLYSSRLSGGGSSGNGNGGGAHPLELVGGGLGLTLPQLQAALAELREDVESMWLAGSESDAC